MEALKFLLLAYAAISLLNVLLALILWRSSRSELYMILLKIWLANLFSFSVHGLVSGETPFERALLFVTVYPLNWFLSHLLCRLTGPTFRGKLFHTGLLVSVPLAFIAHLLGARPWVVVSVVSLAVALPSLVLSFKAFRRWSHYSLVLRGYIVTLFVEGLFTFGYQFFSADQDLLPLGFTLIMLHMVAFTLFSPAAILEMIGKDMAHLELSLRYRAQLDHTAKLVALGEMAGGVAHEINKPLQVLRGLSTLLRKSAEKGTAEKDYIIEKATKIEHTAERIKKIVSTLLAFSKAGENKPMVEEHALEVITSTLDLCRESLEREGVHFELSGNADQQILCRKSEIQEVLMILLSNSRDALVPLTEKWIRIKVLPLENHVRIEVVDSGKGIAEEIADKIFEPFFTSKDMALGSGLGLTVAKGIVESHKGSLVYDNDTGNTRFSFELLRA